MVSCEGQASQRRQPCKQNAASKRINGHLPGENAGGDGQGRALGIKQVSQGSETEYQTVGKLFTSWRVESIIL